MSGFLQNMIQRHQGLVDKVKPRISSIFEPEPIPAASTDNVFVNSEVASANKKSDSSLDSSSILTSPANNEKTTPTLSSPVFGLPEQTFEDNTAPDSNRSGRNRMDLMHEDVQDLQARFTGKSACQRSFNDMHQPQKPLPSDEAGQSPTRFESKEQDSSSRIEELLKQYKHHSVPSPAHADNDLAKYMARLTRKNENKIQESGEASYKQTTVQGVTVHTGVNNQSGALQIPDWLKDWQRQRHARLQEANTHTQTDSVINVTIGRVEVRATSTERQKASPVQIKPKGVLSLDEYLKQRENKGRV